MKKILIILISVFFIGGCGKANKENLVDKFKNEVESAKSYYVESNMELYNNEDVFKYDLKVYYMDDDYFKVNMVNTNNNHEQVILRNSDAVYVITPSLNKSYKFQSDWPYNSSQSYILNSLIKDIENDKNLEFKTLDNGYSLKVKVDYPNNPNMSYEMIKFDKNKNLKNVEVYSKDDILMIKVEYKKIDYKASLKSDEFDVDKIVEENCCTVADDTENTASLDDVIYPLYVPNNTYLKDKEVVSTENGDRAILTFYGDKNFVLIEEAATVSREFETIPVYGEPFLLSNSFGSLTNNSLSWTHNNINYYLTSNDLSSSEILTIASSLNNTVLIEK